MSCQRINTSTKVSNSGYTTEYRLKVSLERHYCSVLDTEIRVWREVINHNQSTYTSHLAPDNSRLPHYSPHTVPGLTNILINCYLWTRWNLNKISTLNYYFKHLYEQVKKRKAIASNTISKQLRRVRTTHSYQLADKLLRVWVKIETVLVTVNMVWNIELLIVFTLTEVVIEIR